MTATPEKINIYFGEISWGQDRQIGTLPLFPVKLFFPWTGVPGTVYSIGGVQSRIMPDTGLQPVWPSA